MYYYHNDHLGSPQAMTNASGTVVWKADYLPFGEAMVDEDPDGDDLLVTDNLRFPGQYFDSETGLHYNWHRDYYPGLGRYIESDPIGVHGGLNLFLYVSNNPLEFSDLLGLRRVCTMHRMLVTAYDDYAFGSDPFYYSGIGNVAVANFNPSTGQPRHDPVRGAYPFYPYGCDVRVYDEKGQPDYYGRVHSTGRGWDAAHHNVHPCEWIDIWLPPKTADIWGKQWRNVEICCDECK